MEAIEAILISNKPKEVAEIFNGKKTIDIRKTAPKEWVDYLSGRTKAKPKPRTAYIYCTKDGYLHLENEGYWSYSRDKKYTYVRHGKVVGKFTLKRIDCTSRKVMRLYAWHISDLEIFDKPKELNEFKRTKLPNPKKIKFVNWKANYYHALGDYSNKVLKKSQQMTVSEVKRTFDDSISIKRPPQSWCYIEVKEMKEGVA